MTNPLRVFAKQGARVPPFVTMGGATGKPEIDPSEAAALCSGMAKHPYMAARFAWAGDNSAREWIKIELQMKAMEASQTHWKHNRLWLPYAEQAKKIHGKAASLVIADMVVAEVQNPWLAGTVAYKMEQFGMHHENDAHKRAYHRHVRPRYVEVAMHMDVWLGAAYAHVAIAQRE